MRLVLTALLVLGLIATVQTAAQAQPQAQPQAYKPSSVYAFEGLTYSRVHGDLAARTSEVGQFQLGLGYQPQGSLWSYELMGRAGWGLSADRETVSLVGWGVRAKRFLPLNSHFSLYGRAGATENLLTDYAGSDLVGFGFDYGVGAMASLRVRALGLLFWPAFFLKFGPKVNVSLWADVGGEIGNLHAGHERSAESRNYRTTSASYGLLVGGNF